VALIVLKKWNLDIIVNVYALAVKFKLTEDSACLLKLIVEACPGVPEVILAQGLESLRNKDYGDALTLFEKIHDARSSDAFLKVLMAWCLFNQRNGLWHKYADEALHLPRDAITNNFLTVLLEVNGQQLPETASTDEQPSGTALYLPTGLAC
jgi:Bacterial type III secretion protein (HrpB1_HrpK)